MLSTDSTDTVPSHPTVSLDSTDPTPEPEAPPPSAPPTKAFGSSQVPSELVLSHLAIVHRMARRYAQSESSREDLISEGCIGLLEAAQRFDPSHGSSFATYAKWWVRYRMQTYARLHRRIVAPPQTRAFRDARRHGPRKRRELEQKHGGPVSRELVAIALGISAEDLAIAERDASIRDRPLAVEHPDAGVAVAAADPSPAGIVELKDHFTKSSAALAQAMETLDAREARIIHEHFLDRRPKSLRELAQALGVSRERVRQLKERSLKKLRVALEEELAPAA
jgi:RNA polymerase sigma-32 factor